MKVLWVDTETGGLVPKKHPVLTFAGIIEIDGEIKGEFYEKLQPLPGQELDAKALEINKLTSREIFEHHKPAAVTVPQLIKELRSYLDPNDRYDRFTLAGHNVNFDANMLDALFEGVGHKLYSLCDYHKLDTMALALYLRMNKHIFVQNVKLTTLASHFGISFGADGAHNALEDIRATRKLYVEMSRHLTWRK